MGHTTNKGFWIPEQPVAPLAEAVLALPEPARPRPVKSHTKSASANRPSRRLTNRPPREIKQEAAEEIEEAPPQVVTLGCVDRLHLMSMNTPSVRLAITCLHLILLQSASAH